MQIHFDPVVVVVVILQIAIMVELVAVEAVVRFGPVVLCVELVVALQSQEVELVVVQEVELVVVQEVELVVVQEVVEEVFQEVQVVRGVVPLLLLLLPLLLLLGVEVEPARLQEPQQA